MDNNEMKALSELKEAIDGVKSNNQTSISTEALSNYLNQLISETKLANNATQQQAARSQAKENFEHKMEVWRVTAPLHNSHQIEMFKSVIEAGGSALKAGMLANGGAAIALLAFVGNAVARADSTISTFSIGLLSNAMLIFFIGSWLSASAYGLRYICQYAYSHEWNKTGMGFHIAAFIFGIASFCFFLWGGFTARHGFLV